MARTLWMLRIGLMLMAPGLEAATLRGAVVEKQSGTPLARALVVAQPVRGSHGATRSARANKNGIFEIADLPAGLYVITASKTGFVTTEYGQKRWFASGTPVDVPEAADLSLKIALPHFGAITGHVLDENNVGIAKCTVLVYRNSRPPELVGKGATDDRGVYRIPGLMPGSYLTRTDTFQSDIGTYLATFGQQTTLVDLAVAADSMLDQDSPGADIRPITGGAYRISGRVWKPTSARGPAQVRLVSDMGSVVTSSEDGAFSFDRLAPGPYELFAQAPDARLGALEGYLALDVQRNVGNIQLDVAPLASAQFSFVDPSGIPVDPVTLPLLGRRKQLSGPAQAEYLALDDHHQAKLGAGRWEFEIGPNSAWYAADFSGPGSREGGPPAAGWNEVVIDPKSGPPVVKFTLSPQTAVLHGTVRSEDRLVAGVPVNLEALQTQSGRRIRDLWTTRTDVQGRYSFPGLPPGDYRVLATFDYQAPESAQMRMARAAQIRIEGVREAELDLQLWVME